MRLWKSVLNFYFTVNKERGEQKKGNEELQLARINQRGGKISFKAGKESWTRQTILKSAGNALVQLESKRFPHTTKM